MLFEFIAIKRQEIISRTNKRVRGRPWPPVSSHETQYGVPIFLGQLSETLRLEATATPLSGDAIGSTAARHGAELMAAGFNVTQVVQDYGDVCQAIVEIALEEKAPIRLEEFHTLNRCLDTAIAEAVTEHVRLSAERRSAEEVERFGRAAHELRDQLNTALIAFEALRRGTLGVNGSTGAVLGRSLGGLRDLIDRTLAEVRLAAKQQFHERLSVASFVNEIVAAGLLHSEPRHVQLTLVPVDPALTVRADPQLLRSAIMNLLHNALKYTRAGGTVVLRAQARDRRLLIEIEDECGGIPQRASDLFQPFGERRGTDRSGLGLGLSIARSAVRGHGGDILTRNMPGKGCVFTIDVPLAAEEANSEQSAGGSSTRRLLDVVPL